MKKRWAWEGYICYEADQSSAKSCCINDTPLCCLSKQKNCLICSVFIVHSQTKYTIQYILFNLFQKKIVQVHILFELRSKEYAIKFIFCQKTTESKCLNKKRSICHIVTFSASQIKVKLTLCLRFYRLTSVRWFGFCLALLSFIESKFHFLLFFLSQRLKLSWSIFI